MMRNNWRCNHCFQNLPYFAIHREAHRLVCLEINDVTCSAAEEEGNDVFIDASVCVTEEVQTTVEQDVHAWIDTLAEQDTLSPEHIIKYMDWGPMPLSKNEEHVAEFLGTVTSSVGMSGAKIEQVLRL
jgi:hypothetical protein